MPSTPPRSPRIDAGSLFFLATLAWSVGILAIGWSHALSDWYGWRQTQTAIAALFIQRGGPWFDYEVPIFGPPWQLPHEFPLYQLLCVGLARIAGLTLEQAGRTVSAGCFYAAVAAGYALLGELGIAPRRRLLALGFWLLSPLYLFWSRTLMVESTALALCLAFLLFAGRLIARGRPLDALAALATGSLGAAVKPPTIVPFAALAGVWCLFAWRRGRLRPRLVAGIAVVTVLPLVAGWGWQRHADSLKSRNPFASGILSGQLLKDWVVAPRLVHADSQALAAVWERAIPFSVGHAAVLAAAAFAVAVAQRRRGLAALAVLGFVVHFAVFGSLDSSLDYYWCGAGVFLAGAVGLAAVALAETGDWRRRLVWPLAASAAIACVQVTLTRMVPLQRVDGFRHPDWTMRLARAVAESTGPDDVVVGFGTDWNPEVAYYSRRRALLWPGWSDVRPESADVGAALASLEGHAVGALFNCRGTAPPETIAVLRERWALVEDPAYRSRCVLYVRPERLRAPEVTPSSLSEAVP